MKLRTAALIVAVGLLVVLVAGCPKQTGTEATKTDTTVQPVSPPAAAGTETKAAGTAAPDEGRKLVEERCTQCHGIDKVEKGKADAEEWGKTVAQMQKNAEKMKKTPITDEEAAKIVEYLAATYGK
jgi:mono/diheme cytochrome c family protein